MGRLWPKAGTHSKVGRTLRRASDHRAAGVQYVKSCDDMPRYSNDLLNSIYYKTDGYCAYCGKKLAFVDYEIQGARAN